MVAFISVLLTRAVKVKDGIDAMIILILLAMMSAMLLGPAYLYLTTLSFGISDVVIWEIAVFMTLGMMPTLGLTAAKFVLKDEPGRAGPPPLSRLVSNMTGLRAAYIVLLLLSEFLMGWTFNLASGLIRLSSGYTVLDVVKELQYSVTTYWFVFTMVAEMGFTLFALRKAMGPSLLRILIIQAVVMFLTPTALSSRTWETYTVYLEAAVMTGLIVFTFDYLRRNRERDRPLLSYLGLFIIANAVMMVGFLLWLVDGDSLLLALSLIGETVIYFDAVLTGAGLGETFHG
jgi:hypothetical protein